MPTKSKAKQTACPKKTSDKESSMELKTADRENIAVWKDAEPAADLAETPGSRWPIDDGEPAHASKTHSDLMRMKKELQVRIRELELELVGAVDHVGGGRHERVEVPDDNGSIVAMVKDLHEEIDATYRLKDKLEADLAAMENEVNERKRAAAKLEAQTKLLEAKAALGEQLQRDLDSAEKKCGETARRLEEVSSQLARMTQQRDSFAEQAEIDAARIQEFQEEMADLEKKVSRLEEAAVEANRLRETLVETREDLQQSQEAARRAADEAENLRGRLEAAEVAKSAIELDLATSRELVRTQNEKLEDLRDCLNSAQIDRDDAQARLESLQTENVRLLDSNRQAVRQIKTLESRIETMRIERDSTKQALRDIHAVTVQTKRRVQKRFSKAGD